MEGVFHISLAINLCSEDLVLERLQFGIDECHYLILTLALLEFALLVDAFLDEDAFERGEEKLFFQLAFSDHQFATEQSHGAVNAMSEHIAHGEELRLVVLDDAAVGRDVDFAIAEGIECIHRFVRRSARSKMYEDFNICRCDVFYLASLDFSLFYRLGNAFDEAYCGFAVWYFADDECFVVEFVNLGSYLQYATSLTVVVFAYVYGTSCREIGVDIEWFTLKVVDSSIAEVVEVMWQYLAAQTHGDALGTLCQE